MHRGWTKMPTYQRKSIEFYQPYWQRRAIINLAFSNTTITNVVETEKKPDRLDDHRDNIHDLYMGS